MKKIFIPLAILLILVFVVTSCGGDPTTTTTQPTSTGTTTTTTQPTTTQVDKYGGTLRYLYPYSPSQIPGWPGDPTDPQRMWAGWTIFEPLVKIMADGSIAPWLATEWEWGADNAYVTFTLREGVHFHDGTTFTSDAVKTQFDQLLAEKSSITVNWDRCEIIGDYQVRLYLKQYMTDFWPGMSNISTMFCSPTALKEKGMDWVKENPIGTGPFKFKSFQKDITLTFERNDDYWQEGKPYVDGIELITVKEALTQQAKMEAGEGDMLALQQGKILKDMQDRGFNIVTQFGGTNMLIFDTMNEGSVYNDVNVRMAIEYAINKQEMADALGYGFLVVTNQPSPPDNPGHNHALPSRDYDPDMAKQLLAEAGHASGLKLTFISDTRSADVVLYLQQYLADVGIELTPEIVDNAKFWNYCMQGWENAALSVGYAVGQNLPAWYRSYFPPTGIFDVSAKIPDNILAKMNEAMIETDTDQFKALSDEVARLVYEDCMIVPIYSNAMGFILAPYVRDAGAMTYVDFSVWDPADIWLDIPFLSILS